MSLTGTRRDATSSWMPDFGNTGISGGMTPSQSNLTTAYFAGPQPARSTAPTSSGSSGKATYALPGGGSTTDFAEYSAAIARQRAQQSAPTAGGATGGSYGAGSPASLPAPAMGQGVVDIKPNFNNPPEPPGGAMDGLQQAGQQPTASIDASQKGGIRQGIGRRMYPDESGPLAALRRIY